MNRNARTVTRLGTWLCLATLAAGCDESSSPCETSSTRAWAIAGSATSENASPANASPIKLAGFYYPMHCAIGGCEGRLVTSVVDLGAADFTEAPFTLQFHVEGSDFEDPAGAWIALYFWLDADDDGLWASTTERATAGTPDAGCAVFAGETRIEYVADCKGVTAGWNIETSVNDYTSIDDATKTGAKIAVDLASLF